MRQELDNKLCEAFPHLYQDRSTGPRHSCMHWGFPGDGWFDIIWELSSCLEPIAANSSPSRCTCRHSADLHTLGPCVGTETRYRRTDDPSHTESYEAQCPCDSYCIDTLRVAQVKEKFGTLRYYMIGGTKEDWELIRPLIAEAEKKSAVTCEYCGSPGQMCSVGYSGGWMKTLCEACETADNEKHGRSGT